MLPFLAVTVGAQGAPLEALHCKDKSLATSSGKTVALKGVNLGGWLVEEIWMTPFVNAATPGGKEEVVDHASLWSTVEKRLGRAAMLRVRDAYRANWITDADFARIRSAGFNHVRLPFLVELLEEKGGLQLLKNAVASAKKHGLYTVLDMHGAPGGQSNEHHTGKQGRNRLWFDVGNIAKMEKAWTAIGKAFADEPAVAIYDLMNEPMGAPNPAMLHLVYDRVIRAVRKVAPKKVVLVDDGYKGFETTPHPNLANWSNVGFSLHFYHFDAKSSAEHAESLSKRMPELVKLQGYRNAPVYAGEFNVEPHGTPEATKGLIEQWDRAGWSWCMWTYKTMAVNGPMGQWGLYSLAGKADAIDPFHDTEAQMLAKIKKARTESMRSAPGLLEMFKAYLGH
ncbi:MAG: cellulase family glycosylhydrolase [Armatimonadetes bacterium]|nr:cellulase family glycosylhydrolase [Armatimonadota bacterium]